MPLTTISKLKSKEKFKNRSVAINYSNKVKLPCENASAGV